MTGLGPAIAVAAVAIGLLLAVVVRKVLRDRRERGSYMRRQALETLAGASLTRLMSACLEAGPPERRDLLDVLRRADEPALARFVAAVDPEVADRVLASAVASRRPAVRGLGLLLAAWLARPQAVEMAAALLRDPDTDVRLAACAALGTIQTAAAAETMIGALGGGYVPHARLAERLGAPWAVGPLVAALGQVPAGCATAGCIRALGLAGDRTAVDAVAPYLRSQSREERICAARALGELGEPRSAPALVEALDDELWEVRAQVAAALGEIGDARVATGLADALGDSSWWVRANAAQSLARLGPAGAALLRRAAEGDDRYASERAKEELQLLEAAAP